MSLAGCTGVASAVEPAATVDGSFTSQTMTMPVSTAMAFRGESALDKTDVIVVAVTHGDLRVDWFASCHVRRRAMQRRQIDNATVVDHFEFKPDGIYRGLPYYFKRGHGCGYCGGGETSTMKLIGGRLGESLKANVLQ